MLSPSFSLISDGLTTQSDVFCFADRMLLETAMPGNYSNFFMVALDKEDTIVVEKPREIVL